MKDNPVTILFATVVIVLAGAGMRAPGDDRMDQLKERFKQRYEKLVELKTDGKIGETFQGFVDWVKEADPASAELVEEENADRRELYKLISENEKTTPELVGERNARRNFEKATKGEYLRGKDRTWTRK